MELRWFTDYDPSPRWPHYTRANAGEVLPAPASPLGQKLTFDLGLIHGCAEGSCRTGLYEMSEYDPVLPETFGFFGGYLYLNLSNIRMQGVRNPAVTVEQLDTAFFGDHPDVPLYTAHPDDEKPHLLPKIGEHTAWVMSCEEWPELLDDRATVAGLRAARPDLGSASDSELLTRIRDMVPWLVHTYSQHYVSSSSSGIAPGILGVVGEAIGDPTIPMRLLAGMGDVDSAQSSYRLWELSRMVRSSPVLTAAFDAGLSDLTERLEGSGEGRAFNAAWSAFIDEFGARGPTEYEISGPAWETHPAIPLAALDRVRFQSDDASPQQRAGALAAERQAVTHEVREKLAELGDAELSGMFEGALIGGNMMVFRERTKTHFVQVVHEIRMAVRELGRRHAEAGELEAADHIFMLTEAELDDYVAEPAPFKATLAQRMRDWKRLWELEPPFIIADGNVPPLSEWKRRGHRQVAAAQVGEVLTGVAGSPGTVTGRARVVQDSADPGDLRPDDIMIAPLTDSSWGPLFTAVAGVVVNVGGQISHAVIVSRELGLPSVVSIEDATERIPDGAIIELDGRTGEVTVLELPADVTA